MYKLPSSEQSSRTAQSPSDSVAKAQQPPTCTPNILPCRIHQDGAIENAERYWKPERGIDGILEAYFRGRKLQGREVHLPQGYRGAVVQKRTPASRGDQGSGNGAHTSQMDMQWSNQEDEESAEEDKIAEPIGLLEEQGSFDDLIVWAHERVVDNDDVFVRGVEEWTTFAEAMHGPEALLPRSGATSSK